ncbi:MAG: sigma-54-dependent transcriptional regulator [Thermodesulfovibrionales bacterium]
MDKGKRILIVDDDPQMRIALKEAINRLGYDADTATDGRDALRRLNNTNYALIITDMKMPGMDGLSFLKEARKRWNIPVLVITGFGTVENAVETMKEGATDYLMKPFSFDAIGKAIESILSRIQHEREIITEDPEMKKIIALARNIAGSEITVLITGESGTGKELLARYIHRASRRKEAPFIAVNCAAIPDNLLESELFGYEKGAFTGAVDKKAGKFELANGGTLLLDEIGEMPLILQAKLLRVLQEREVDRIGGKKPIPIDVRIIATTNRDLKKECGEGRFREDLYYRLNVFPIRIPPLRERKRDISALAWHFIKKFSALSGKNIKGLSEEALEALMNRPWRGNVRELENVIQRATLISSGDLIKPEDLMFDDINTPQNTGRIREMEKDLILRTLEEVEGNKTRAAKILGVSVRTIRNKLNEYRMLGYL